MDVLSDYNPEDANGFIRINALRYWASTTGMIFLKDLGPVV